MPEQNVNENSTKNLNEQQNCSLLKRLIRLFSWTTKSKSSENISSSLNGHQPGSLMHELCEDETTRTHAAMKRLSEMSIMESEARATVEVSAKELEAALAEFNSQ